MLGQADLSTNIWSDTAAPVDPNAPAASGGFWSSLPDLFKSYEQARVYDAATKAQIAQINQFANINPLWIVAGVFLVLIAFARR